MRSRRLDRSLTMIYGDARIEDLWRPFLCVSCNITTTEMAVHRRGPVWRALRGSLAIPGVFTPAIEGGELLVDGGVLNNLPGDLLRADGCGRVIAVDVSPPQELAVECNEFPSPWRTLWRRILHRQDACATVPSVLDILMRTLVIGSDHRVKEVKRDADLWLAPPVAHYTMLQFDALREIAEAGYSYTRQVLASPNRPPWLTEWVSA